MPDISLIAGAISSMRAASQMAAGLVDIRDGVKLQSEVIKLQGLIMDAQSSTASAQSELLTLLVRVRDLEDEIATVRRWEAIAERYRLKDYGGQTFAYELRLEHTSDEPLHKICVTCFDQRKRSVLQHRNRGADQREYYECHGCKTVQHLGLRVPDRTDYNSPEMIRRRTEFDPFV